MNVRWMIPAMRARRIDRNHGDRTDRDDARRQCAHVRRRDLRPGSADAARSTRAPGTRGRCCAAGSSRSAPGAGSAGSACDDGRGA